MVTELKDTITDLKSRMSCLRKSFNNPLSSMFEQVDTVRMTVLEAVESQSSQLNESLSKLKHAEQALEEARAIAAENATNAVAALETPSEELLEELEKLRTTTQKAEQEQMMAHELTRKAERERTEANERYEKEFLERKRLFNTVQELKGNIR